MRNTKTFLVVVALALTGLAPTAVLAQARVRGINTGAHAAAMNSISQANQQHNAVITSVQQNINANLHR